MGSGGRGRGFIGSIEHLVDPESRDRWRSVGLNRVIYGIVSGGSLLYIVAFLEIPGPWCFCHSEVIWP